MNNNISAPKPARIVSIDALRGFDMLWIAGGAKVIESLHRGANNQYTGFLAEQMKHASWQGFTFLDIIMPLFLFITGCSAVFSIQNRLQVAGEHSFYRHVLTRVAILWLLGMVFQGKLLSFDPAQFDYFSNTLQAIAIGYLGTCLIVRNFTLAKQIAITAFLLVSYWALMHFVPGYDFGVKTNLAYRIDELVLGAYRGDVEYTWVLTSFTFICTTMLGAFAGQILKNVKFTQYKKLQYLFVFGVVLTVAGHLLSLHDPCIKKIGTSSFTLISAGYCAILLAIFYGLFDIIGLKRLALPFVVLGQNAILVYMIFAYSRFINLAPTSKKLLFGFQENLTVWYPLAVSVMSVILMWLIFYFLYQKKAFLKI